ncbi:MAG TPA: hypothetical protein ENF49_04255, partial [Candidatus Altiarchaeales archaeon]|nr:hypothetical protein [Candidatus Altiarchaeales archaeon]HEX55323.1 hypothetical protein [Candidatus Altiarchaeales archaeon]
MKIYTIIARILPVRIRAKFRQLIMYSNLNLDPDSFLGFIILFGLLSSLVFAYTLAALGMGNFILIFIVLFVLIEFSFYIIILFSIDSKTKA